VSPERVTVEVDGRELTLSNLDKILYPEVGFSKRDVLDYYARIADVMVPHLAHRPATFKRFPNGVEGSFFFEKHIPSHAPPWVERVTVPRGANSRSGNGADVEYAVISDRPSLVWAANLASLEFHVPQWRIDNKRRVPKPPDLMVFDLDPGPGTTIVECCRVAGWLAEEIGRDGVTVKTSGSKGLQLYLRLVDPGVDSNELAHELARKLERDHPEDVVSNMKKELRKNKVLIDWSQNSPAKTTIAVYSMRARARPTVSTPVTWDEIDGCARSGRLEELEFVAGDVLDRVERLGDLFEVLLEPGDP
jgi:bifunctional non-homologous end joining protein LigD